MARERESRAAADEAVQAHQRAAEELARLEAQLDALRFVHGGAE